MWQRCTLSRAQAIAQRTVSMVNYIRQILAHVLFTTFQAEILHESNTKTNKTKKLGGEEEGRAGGEGGGDKFPPADGAE